MDNRDFHDQFHDRMSPPAIHDEGIRRLGCCRCESCCENSPERQLMACDSSVQLCEVAHFNAMRNNGCWDAYKGCEANNNNSIRKAQPTLLNMLTSGSIAMIGREEQGSRLVQEEFAKSSPSVRQMMLDYLFERGGFDRLYNNSHGNFIIQKIVMESRPGIEQARVAEYMANRIVRICSNRYGSRIVQRIFDRIDFKPRTEVLKMLRGSECFLAVNKCATYVMQKLFALFVPTQYFFIVTAMTFSKAIFKQVVENKYGCRVIESALEELESAVFTTRFDGYPVEFRAARRLLDKLLRRVTGNCVDFVNHQYANYVIQHVITSRFHPEARDLIVRRAVLRNMLTLSQEKYGSHVVEKSLKFASLAMLHCLMDEVFDGYIPDERGRSALDIMLFDHFGNYVVQTMLSVSIDVRNGQREGDPQWLIRLARRIARHENRLQKYSSGKKMIAILEQCAA